MTTCPKCGHKRRDHETHVHVGICPACTVAYDKYLASLQAKASSDIELDDSPESDEHDARLTTRLQETLLYFEEPVDPTLLSIKAGVLGVFICWGAAFVVGGIDWMSIGGSFLHNANLAFHEFGHVFFSPFGRFMTILGGSLFQVMLPLILLGVFVIKQRDNFGGAICLWWCGQNFIDVSPYIADAEYRVLPLIRGMDESAHDWGNLLSMTDSLHSAQALATTAFVLGALIMATSMLWAARLLWLQYRSLAH